MSVYYDLLCNILAFVFSVLAFLSLFRYAVFERIYGNFSLKPCRMKLALSIFSVFSGTAFIVKLYSFGFHLLSPLCFVLYCFFCYLVVRVCLVLVTLRMEEVYMWYEACPDKHFKVWLERRCWIFEMPGLYPSYDSWAKSKE